MSDERSQNSNGWDRDGWGFTGSCCLDTDEELPLFVPEYLGNVVQPDHGYHPGPRRRRPDGT